MPRKKKDASASFETIEQILEKKRKKFTSQRVYAHHEFQDYGVWLSQQLHDSRHKGLYIKLAKEKLRNLLQEAMIFAIGYNTKSPNRGKLFMWKLKELEKETKDNSQKSP